MRWIAETDSPYGDMVSRKQSLPFIPSQPALQAEGETDAFARPRALSQHEPGRQESGLLGWGKSRIKRLLALFYEDSSLEKTTGDVHAESEKNSVKYATAVEHDVKASVFTALELKQTNLQRLTQTQARPAETVRDNNSMRKTKSNSPQSIIQAVVPQRGLYSPKDTARKHRRMKRVLFPVETPSTDASYV